MASPSLSQSSESYSIAKWAFAGLDILGGPSKVGEIISIVLGASLVLIED
jgi:hypothetical protein